MVEEEKERERIIVVPSGGVGAGTVAGVTLIGVAALILLYWWYTQQQGKAGGGTGVLQFMVHDDATGVAIDGVALAVSGAGTASVTTDYSGFATVTGVVDGTYYVSCTKAGYDTKTVTVAGKNGGSILTTIALHKTGGPPGVTPTIISTSPPNGVTSVSPDVSIVVTFSKKMDPAATTISCSPDPGGWNKTWDSTGTVMTCTHTSFAPNTVYTLNVTGKDTAGHDLGAGAVPNPWSFTTGAAPTTGTLDIYVQDSTDNTAVGGATVRLSGANTGSQNADGAGHVHFSGLTAGTTFVNISKGGYITRVFPTPVTSGSLTAYLHIPKASILFESTNPQGHQDWHLADPDGVGVVHVHLMVHTAGCFWGGKVKLRLLRLGGEVWSTGDLGVGVAFGDINWDFNISPAVVFDEVVYDDALALGVIDHVKVTLTSA